MKNGISDVNREAVEAHALAFHLAHVGRLLEVGYLCGYTEDDDSEDVACSAIVRVSPVDGNTHQDICHWNDEWLDPYWDVELISGDERAKSLRSIWIDGPSVNAITGVTQWKDVRVLSAWEAFKVRLKGFVN